MTKWLGYNNAGVTMSYKKLLFENLGGEMSL